eukprot:CAMPEP_0196597450 /NCGR_PEP_ID=MMETSP1081-20130531/91316_1 /TAXON_ID=36882 /ORGANISM="Pyramimonas amylifera, Strain CCMP720" /LENGTH=287 /DNA_ID=CAMNT_0041922849 /DNA_START=74 /DNA_END=937 /DNA_ORIENTATION=+
MEEPSFVTECEMNINSFHVVEPVDSSLAGLQHAKMKLNTRCAAAKGSLPEYSIISQSFQHNVHKFVVKIKIYTDQAFYTEGPSIKSAQRKAAKVALESLMAENPLDWEVEQELTNVEKEVEKKELKRKATEDSMTATEMLFLSPGRVHEIINQDPKLTQPKSVLKSLCKQCHVPSPQYKMTKHMFVAQVVMHDGECFTSDLKETLREAHGDAATKAIKSIELKMEEFFIQSIKKRRLEYDESSNMEIQNQKIARRTIVLTDNQQMDQTPILALENSENLELVSRQAV